MTRSKWKGPSITENSLKDIRQLKKNYVRTTIARSSTILPKFIDKILKVYNGKKFNELLVTEEMIGHKFGEFSATRKCFSFKKKTKK